jgi:hypothetical protein
MIIKTKAGYQVRSEEGKNLSADNLSLQDAHERLKEVESLKSLRKWAKSKGA